jgi:hypothetical protein
MLCLQTPGNVTRSIAARASRRRRPAQDGSGGPVDFARVGLSAQQTQAIEILGPPPL